MIYSPVNRAKFVEY